MDNTAYIVTGFESSGNRLLASVLARSGCRGEGSTNQPKTGCDIPGPMKTPYVMIQHRNLAFWIRWLRFRGYRNIFVLLIIREPIANVLSAVNRGHIDPVTEEPLDIESAHEHRIEVIADAVQVSRQRGVNLEILTYEGLSESFLKQWLPRIGLGYTPGILDLPGQDSPAEIENQNFKHYQGEIDV